jgi:hypothetical protein
MTACPSTEGTYVPWSFGEIFACVACGHRVRQPHTVPPLRGEDDTAIYPIPPHQKAEPMTPSDARSLADYPAALGGGEVHTDDEGDSYFSIETGGYQEAVEVELHPELADAERYLVFVRAWDQTHGLSFEDEDSAWEHPGEAAQRVSQILAEREAWVEQMEFDLSPSRQLAARYLQEN